MLEAQGDIEFLYLACKGNYEKYAEVIHGKIPYYGIADT
jgi:hypothetical protein